MSNMIASIKENHPGHKSYNVQGGTVANLKATRRDETVIIPTSIHDRTDALVRGVVVLLKHHNAQPKLVEEMSSFLFTFLDSSQDERDWIRRVKDLLCRPLALYLRNEPPERKEGSAYFEFSGLLRRWYRARINHYSRTNTHLWYSWLQLKRCTLPVSDSFVNDVYEEHRLSLTEADRGVDKTVLKVLSNSAFHRVLEDVRHNVNRLYDRRDLFTRTPSSNACWESTRSQGGSLGYLRIVTGVEGDFTPVSELLSMRHYEHVQIGASSTPRVVEYRSPLLSDSFRSYFERMQKQLTPQMLRCRIQAVLEPMKVRVISKGESFPYYMAKTLQRALHRSVSEVEGMHLLRGPLCPTDLLDLRVPGEGNEWFSIDYTAATDRLSWKYSSRILDHVIQDFPLKEREFLKQVLAPHWLSYPKRKVVNPAYPSSDSTQFFEQRSGQLMGSILSFPILCLANLGVYLEVTEEFHRGLGIVDYRERCSKVLVNGDDMLYVAPSSLWDIHREVAGDCGLTMSLGKAYHHPRYANVNSVSVDMDLARTDSTPFRIDFLNVGLFFGQHKVQGNRTHECADDHHAVESCAVNLPVVLQGCLPKRHKDICKQYLALHSEKIAQECRFYVDGKMASRNIFLPTLFGGLGVELPYGFRTRVTREQRLLASYYVGGSSVERRPYPRGYQPREVQTFRPRVYDCGWTQMEPLRITTKDLTPFSRSKIIFGDSVLWCEKPLVLLR